MPTDRKNTPDPGPVGDSLVYQQEFLPLDTLILQRDVRVNAYFEVLDSIVVAWDSLTPYRLTEHMLVRSNPWIIDTLEHTDYYYMMARDSFVFDQKELLVLRKGDTLFVPSPGLAALIEAQQRRIVLDLNIPEYRLRIVDPPDTLFSFPVRVGRNERKYLAMSGRVTDLRTQPGEGVIVRLNRNPIYINPADNRRYQYTRRDDGRTTRLPRIPWIEPAVDSIRFGHLIHPTTNPQTLGKAYSNGCIGTREGDMWRIYYYGPVGTKVHFRYDLTVIDPGGDTTFLPDIYGWGDR